MQGISNLAARCKAFGVHLILSFLVAITAALLVFCLWYPWPFRILAGGQTLFLLVVTVDLILGPLLTFIVVSSGKPKSVLVRDLIVIVCLQLAGLSYGIYSVYLARPVAMVYEPGRFRVIAYVDVVERELSTALPEVRTLPLKGLRVLGTRKPRNAEEKMDSVMIALAGVDIGKRPSFWQPYEKSVPDILKEARPLSALVKQYPSAAQNIERYIKELGRSPADMQFLPILSKHENWSALIDAKTAEIVGYVPYEGFF